MLEKDGLRGDGMCRYGMRGILGCADIELQTQRREICTVLYVVQCCVGGWREFNFEKDLTVVKAGEGGGAVRGMKLAKEPLISACCVIVTHGCTLVKSEMISAGTQDGW